jgi:ABC-2 type transport system permease protein
LFWLGAFHNKSQIGGWTLNNITAYYFLLTIASSLLVSHIEEDISDYDIKQGDLVRYLLRPYSYYWIKFFEETPWRLLQGFYGIILLAIFLFWLGNFLQLHVNVDWYFITPAIILAYFISFTYKMNLGLTAFWLKDARALHQVLEIIAIVLGGGVVPLELMPGYLKKIADLTPFPYITYYPITIFQGKYQLDILLKIIGFQFLWLSFLLIARRVMWSRGIRSFTATGQ